MKKLLIFLLLQSTVICAQPNLEDIYQKSKKHTLNGMIAFNSWTFSNILANSIAFYQTSNETKYFCEMNVFFNIINAGIGVPGLIAAIKNHKKNEQVDFERSFKSIQQLKTIYLVNAVLDISYVTSGFLLREMAKNQANNMDRFNGYGNSLIMQGAFLLIYDFVMFGIHQANGKKLDEFWKRVKLSPLGPENQLGLSIRYSLQ